MSNEERLKAAGWKRLHQPCDLTMYRWTRDGIDWYTEDEALVEVLTAERDAAIARAEAAEALAASRLDVSQADREQLLALLTDDDSDDSVPKWVERVVEALCTSLAPAWEAAFSEGTRKRVRSALRAHAAKVSR